MRAFLRRNVLKDCESLRVKNKDWRYSKLKILWLFIYKTSWDSVAFVLWTEIVKIDIKLVHQANRYLVWEIKIENKNIFWKSTLNISALEV